MTHENGITGITGPPERLTETIDHAYAADWRNVGDAYESFDADGIPCVKLPPHAHVVLASSPAGRLYIYDPGAVHIGKGAFTSPERADAFAAKVLAKGTIDLTYWRYLRGMYGTPAYEADGWADYDEALD